MLNLQRLRLLYELQTRGTLADVATALHMSPSAVSQQLSTLERETGVDLLRRSGRRVVLTPLAEQLCRRTKVLLDLIEEAESELGSPGQELVGTVRIAAFQSVLLALVPGMLAVLKSRHRELRVTVTQHEPEDALERTWTRDFDLVIAEQYPHHAAPHHPGLDRVELMSDPLRLRVPPSWTDVTSLADVTDVPWVMEPHGAASRHWALQRCRRTGFEPDVRFETADLQAHLALVEAGEAVALLPDLMGAVADGRTRGVALPDAPARTIFTAARSGSQDLASVAACRQVLHDVAAQRLIP